MGYKMKTLGIFCVLGFVWLSEADAQQSRIHNVYAEGFGPSIVYTLNYDTRFKSTHNGLGMRAGIGFWTETPENFHRIAIPLQLNYLFGKRRHLFELGAGPTLMHSGGGGGPWDIVEKEGVTLVGTLSAGYRFQPVVQGINARIGATLLYANTGFPGVIPGFSLGYTFSK